MKKENTVETTTKPMAHDALLGSVVIHKKTGELMCVKKIHGQIAICASEIWRVINEKPFLSTNTVVCNIDNIRIATDTEKTKHIGNF